MSTAARTTISETSTTLWLYGIGCGNWHDQMVGIVDSFALTSSAETADLVSMRRFVSEIGTVVEAACDIEQRRWESANAR
jgi:hypothetical protein